MHRGTGQPARVAEIQRQVEVEHFCYRLRDRVVNLADSFDILRQHQRLMGDVQTRHGQRYAGFEYHFGGFRVDENIKFRHRGGVAGVHAAAHKDDTLDVALQLRVLSQQQGDIGHWTGNHQGDGLRAAAQQAGDQFDGALFYRLDGGRWQMGIAHAGFAMHIVGNHQLTH
ncbi:hypothetical protein D3C81_1698050 [compost metagenome]